MSENFGGIVISGGGRFLVREPANHFGGVAWTFAKTKAEPAETPEDTALRAVREKTGYRARVRHHLPGSFRSGSGVSSYFLMEALHSAGTMNWQTASLRWETYDAALALIGQSTNALARERDVTLLEMARAAFMKIPLAQHLTVQPADHPSLRPMPSQHTTLHPNLAFRAAEMESIRRGFVWYDDDARWFIYFSGERLRLHRSWTGVLIFDLGFAIDAQGNATVTDVQVNRDPAEYQSFDDEDDIRSLKQIIETHLLTTAAFPVWLSPAEPFSAG